MGRTWLVRGAAAAVVAVLIGAWGVGVAGIGNSDPPAEERITPPEPDTSVAPDNEGSVVGKKAKPPRAPETAETRDAAAKPSPNTDDEPAEDAPTTPVPTSSDPTPDDPTHDPPSDSPPPPDPSDPPSEPSDECTEPILDCILNPITANP